MVDLARLPGGDARAFGWHVIRLGWLCEVAGVTLWGPWGDLRGCWDDLAGLLDLHARTLEWHAMMRG